MRYRPRDYRDDNPEVFEKLIKINPYIKKIYDYPNLILPYPTPENFKELWGSKLKGMHSGSFSGIIHLEIGCGSGSYLIEWAKKQPQDVFIGLDLRFKRLVLAAKKIARQNIQNILLIRERGEFIDEYLTRDSIDFLHINFPDPWPKKSRQKHRILNLDFLRKIYPLLSSKGELRFKTDHLEYFETISNIINETDHYNIVEHTTDLYKSNYNKDNILTEFEMLFKSKGNPPIGFLLAKKL